MNKQSIGIFDSGIGGLTVLNEYKKLLPNENFIYYADIAHLPYGDKTQKQIIEYSKNIVEHLIKKDVKAIVIACGTASSYAYDYLIKNYKIPIFNIIDPVAKNIKAEKIGLIATPASIASNVWQNKIKYFQPNSNVTAVACPKLALLAEKGLVNSLETENALKDYLSVFKSQKIDALILGCTHYPLFSHLIKKELDEEIKIVNVGYYSAIEFSNFIKENNLENSTQNLGNVIYIVNGDKLEFEEKANKLIY